MLDFHSQKVTFLSLFETLQWRHNERDGVSNHLRFYCFLNRLFRRRSKKTPKLRVTGLYEGNSPVNSTNKGPVTRKMFPFDDVIGDLHSDRVLAYMNTTRRQLNYIIFLGQLMIHDALRPRQDGCHFADNIFKCIFVNETFEFQIKFHRNMFLLGLIDHTPALVQIMAWRR